jgi:hypothetical protein
MDNGRLRASYGSTSTAKSADEYLSILADGSLINKVNLNEKSINWESQPKINSFAAPFNGKTYGDSHEDFDFSDVVLKYINQMLMEDVEGKTCMFQESAALQAAEKSFYEALVDKYPSSSSSSITSYSDICTSSSSVSPSWSDNVGDRNQKHFQTRSQLSVSSSSNLTDGMVDSPVSTLRIPNIFSDSRSVMQFNKGVEEAQKFLPNRNSISLDPKRDTQKIHSDISRGKKNPFPKDGDLEQEHRGNKQSALYSESTIRSEMFDLVLLCNHGQGDSALRQALQSGANKNTQKEARKGRGRKNNKKEVIDLRTLLTVCAQAVAANDRRSANELLTQIRQHSSPAGDGMQRLAHYFAGGLEARMAGSSTEVYRSLITLPTSGADILKAYHLYLATCPFRKITNFFSNKTIMKVAEKASKVHIIDFGIYYGFQWPVLIQRLSSRLGGPPQLRITGIDFPHPGFRPAERVEETGRRLANYAETFGVPFQFNAIAKKWDTVQIEDLKIEEDEVVVVNCLYRLRNLLDETVVVDSPRNIVLNLIRRINPAIFIHGNVNGSYNAPFFITRFREALFHFSSLFDMMDANVPRHIHERLLFEKIIFGREAMNVIACEGVERIERPETYKQAQVRNLRAGFKQLDLDKEIMGMSKERVKLRYHKDFVIDEDGKWMLQGWKGRIVYALSTWRVA